MKTPIYIHMRPMALKALLLASAITAMAANINVTAATEQDNLPVTISQAETPDTEV